MSFNSLPTNSRGEDVYGRGVESDGLLEPSILKPQTQQRERRGEETVKNGSYAHQEIGNVFMDLETSSRVNTQLNTQTKRKIQNSLDRHVNDEVLPRTAKGSMRY